MINTVCAAQRLALRSSGFKISDEIATDIVGVIAAKLNNVLMAALGSCFEYLSGEDVNAIFELYKATTSVVTMADAVIVHEVLDSVAEQ